ncbi:MAG TPA: Uma2 family endonuclease [Epsilonproteobacteria bacterium]|nr:Uma2 family endonuclease [Campylobacterota bacterium]
MAAIDYDNFQYYTFDDYRQWEDRWELIDGVAYAMSPAPYPKHQRVVLRIAKELGDHLVCSNDACEFYISPIDWKINESTVVQPDVALFCEETEAQYFSKTPPLIVEVLSRVTALKDVTTKKDLYEREGVRFYVIVEPHTEITDIFKLIDGKYQHIGKYTKENSVDFELSDACRSAIDFSQVF